MDFLELTKKRYSVKLFSGEKIKTKDLEKLKESIILAPSSFNLQPWKIKIIDDKKTLKKLQDASFGQPQIGSSSHLFVFCSYNNLQERKEELYNLVQNTMNIEKFENHKKIIDNFFKSQTKEELKRISERETFLALENLMLCATSLGYGSCPVGGFQPDKYKEILKIEDNLNPIVVCPVGTTADSPRNKIRFPKEKTFF